MKSELEKRLENAPLAPPPESLDRKIEALTSGGAGAGTPAHFGWLSFRLPAWAAGLGCVVGFFVGLAFAGPRDEDPAPAPGGVALPAAPEPGSPPRGGPGARPPAGPVAAVVYIERPSAEAAEVFSAFPEGDAESFFAATHRIKSDG